LKHMIDTLIIEDGKVLMNGVPFTFTMTKSIYYTQKELEKIIGDKWKRLFYERGRTDAIATVAGYLAMFHNKQEIKKFLSDRLEGVKFSMDEYNRMGLGRAEMVTGDPERQIFVFRYYFSPSALAFLEHEKSKEPICYHFAGICAGAVSIFYPGIEATELKCMAMGDPYCEVVASIPKR